MKSGQVRLLAAALLSGVAALVHELLWIRLLGHLFGQTIYAVQTVLAVFFLGIALGGWAYSRSIHLSNMSGARLFRIAEVAIAAWALLMPLIMQWATPLFDRFAPSAAETPRAFIVRIIVTCAVLLVPATLMGLTLPALISEMGSDFRGIRIVYGANTIGAAAGAWFSTFALVPQLGVRGTLLFGAGLNIAAAVLIARRVDRSSTADRAQDLPLDSADLSPRAAAIILFLSGAGALALEVLWTRALEQIVSGTIYSFATVLTVFLLGIGLGSLLVRRRTATREAAGTLFGALALIVAITPFLIRLIGRADEALRSFANASLAGGAFTETAVASLLLLLPTTSMGMLFPLLLRLGVATDARAVGRMTAANTAGSVLGPLVAGFAILPSFGVRGGIAAIAVIQAAVALFLSPRKSTLIAATAVIALALVPAGTLMPQSAGETIVAQREDAAARVAVVEENGERRLKVNNSYSLGGGRGVFTERRQGHIAMLLHPNPQRVLVLGIGTGNTLGAIAAHAPEEIVAVDLLPGVIDLAGRHFSTTNEGVLSNERVDVKIADAARVARSPGAPFDLVVADLFHPWQAGVSSLYSLEHFEHVRDRLASDGLFVQWLPLYQLMNADFRCITRTFLRVYPHAEAWLGNFGSTTPIVALVGSRSPLRTPKTIRVPPGLESRFRELYLDVPAEWAASYVAGRTLLEEYAGAGPVNTLDRPILEFSAAAHFFSRRFDSEKHETLVDLVRLAARQDRATTGTAGSAYGLQRLGMRALVISFVAAEQQRWPEAVEAAKIASIELPSYALPLDVLNALGIQLHDGSPSLARAAFEFVLQKRPADRRAREGLELLKSR